MARKSSADDGLEHRLHRSVSCFAFNGDRTQIAISPNDSNILVYEVTPGSTDQWKLLHELKGHDSFVSGIDWSATTNLIVSSGHDRNAYVWRFDGGKWSPTLVILRINRAANCVQWSPDGNKFAVGSAAKQVPVCHYEVSNNWWVSKMIKRHKSSILTLDWHRNNKFLLTGGSDYKTRIFSAFISDIDSTDDEEDFENIFKDQFKFGAILAEFDCSKGWIESVRWSPSGFRVAFVGHDSTITFVQILEGAEPNVQCLRVKNLPFREVIFLSDDCIVAAGHECNPYLYVNKGSEATPNWEFREKLDKEGAEGAGGAAKKSSKVSAFAASKLLFQSTTSKGTSGSGMGPTVLKTRHQNQITECKVLFEDDSESSSSFWSCGTDGRILNWDLKKLGISMDGLNIS
uniref:Actin-related protein 2/3 complex subunit n=1 Tax=Hirondellea gigas TaxID=1518452 RepID=A0A6A7G229_9CRUS